MAKQKKNVQLPLLIDVSKTNTSVNHLFSHLKPSTVSKNKNENKKLPKNPKHTRQDFIDSAWAKFEGTCPPPDTVAAFVKLDRDSTGFLDRQRFALALRDLRPSLELPPPLLLAAMEFFDTVDGGEGMGTGGGQLGRGGGRGRNGRIDYRYVSGTEVSLFSL